MDAAESGAGAAQEDADSVSARLAGLARDAEGERVSLGWILERLGESAFGLFLLVLALPCAVPFLYGVPQVMSLPLLFVSGQLVAGRRTPWLPEKLARREVSVASLREIHRRAEPWLRRVEVILRPRLQLLSRPPLDRLVGVVLVICSLSIMVPLPLTNTTPGIAVALIALGFLERDGLVIAGASALGLAWVSFLLYLAIFIPAKLFGAA